MKHRLLVAGIAAVVSAVVTAVVLLLAAVPGHAAERSPGVVTPSVSNYLLAIPGTQRCAEAVHLGAGQSVVSARCNASKYWTVVSVRAGCLQLRTPGGHYALGSRRGHPALVVPRDLRDSCLTMADNPLDVVQGRDEIWFGYLSAYLYWNTPPNARLGFTRHSSGHTQWDTRPR